MELFFDKINIILFITVFLNIILGLLIYFRGRERKINVVYSLNVVAVVGWVLAMIIYRAASAESSLFWCIALYISPTFIASSFLYFTYIFPFQAKGSTSFKWALIILGNIAIVAFVLIPKFIIKDVIINPGAEKGIIFGFGYILYVIYIAFYFSYGLWRLFKKYLRSQGVQRSQIIYLLLGYAIATNLAFITNLFMPWLGRTELNWLGQIFSLSMVGFTAYAIIRHRLMDVQFVVKRSTIFSVMTLAITATYILAAVLFGWVVFGGTYTFKSLVFSGLFVAVLTSLGFIPLYKWLQKITDKFLFKGSYNPQELLSETSDILSQTLDLDKIIGVLEEKIGGALRTRNIEVIALKEKDFFGLENDQKNNNALWKIITYFEKEKEALVLDELKRKYADKIKFDKSFLLIEDLEKLKAALIVPLKLKEKLVGFFILGNKKSGDMFTDGDIRTLETIAAQAAIAIENARLYEEMKDFSKTLQNEVERQTKELKDANFRLEELDKAKSEFISLASHQLRTPLSIIKGYISMILEGVWGEINKDQKNYLKKVFLSNERLINLVEDLLTVSRIESGRLEFKPHLLSMEELVENIANDSAVIAAKRGLYLKYKKSKKPLSRVKVDSLQIRQVIQNLVDNAIHYTKKGGATIRLQEENKKIIFSIQDTGIGISSKEKLNLFKKFSRGKGMSKIYTEGTGLGLYLASKLIQAHKGKIWVESEGKGKGSKFCFELPVE